jgi:hypothetical protein
VIGPRDARSTAGNIAAGFGRDVTEITFRRAVLRMMGAWQRRPPIATTWL